MEERRGSDPGDPQSEVEHEDLAPARHQRFLETSLRRAGAL